METLWTWVFVRAQVIATSRRESSGSAFHPVDQESSSQKAEPASVGQKNYSASTGLSSTSIYGAFPDKQPWVRDSFRLAPK